MKIIVYEREADSSGIMWAHLYIDDKSRAYAPLSTIKKRVNTLLNNCGNATLTIKRER